MKKILLFVFVCLISSCFLFIPVVDARAGGGSSSSSGTRHSSSNGKTNPISSVITTILFMGVAYSSIIIIKVRLTKAKVTTKRKFKRIKWDYELVEKRVEESYFIIQNAWAENNMKKAKRYMTPELLDNFQSKLNWMEVCNKKNIMKNIKLLDCYPISFVDEEKDCDDRLWVYIKGKMIDYVIDLKTNEVIEGSTMNKWFVEYWLFSKNKKGEWVLNKILQEDQLENVPIES